VAVRLERITVGDVVVAEVVADGVVIATAGDVVQLLAEAGAERIVLREHNLAPEFFTLSSGLAGEVAQKFVNYGVRLAVVGDFGAYDSRSLRAFMVESNRTGRIVFVESREEALRRFGAGS
jgi:hypothetical protein